MNRIRLSKGVFESLLEQLVHLEEERLDLIERFIAVPAERDGMASLLDGYIAGVGRLVRDSVRTEDAGNLVPFVAIHSEVELEDAESHDALKIIIVSPLDDDIQSDGVSYLSPLGSSLLLKGVGEEVAVKAPGGVYRYRVKSVQMRDRH